MDDRRAWGCNQFSVTVDGPCRAVVIMILIHICLLANKEKKGIILNDILACF